MIIDLNELRSKLRLIPSKCDKATVTINSQDNELLIVGFKDHTNLSHFIYLREFDDD